MEISSAWRIRSESPESEAARIMVKDVAFSPTGHSFCSFAGSSIFHNSNNLVKEVQLELDAGEQITTCSTITENPWICAVGTNYGKFITINLNSEIRTYIFHTTQLEKIVFNRINESLSSFILVYNPNIFVYIALSELDYANKSAKYVPLAQKFSVPTANIQNIQLIKAKNNQLRLYVTSNDKFLSVYEMNTPYKSSITSGITSIAKSLNPLGKSFKDSLPTVLKTYQDYNDASKLAISLAISPDSKFIAISDNIGRISLIDVNNECIVSVKRDISDGQLAWYGNAEHYKLIIYAPRKEALFVVNVPSFELVDCVKLQGTGKLYQNYSGVAYSVIFMDSSGNIANLKMSSRHKHRTHAHELDPLEHPELGQISTPDLDLEQSIIECLSKASPQKEKVMELISEVTNLELAGHIVKILAKFENVTDDFLQDCISSLKNTTNYHIPSPVKRQFDNYLSDFSGEKMKPEEEFGHFVGLAALWSDAMNIEALTYPIQEFPKSEITTWYSQNYEAQALTPPKYVPLRLFITEPLRNFEILFATLRKGASYYDFIRIMMVVSPTSIDKFIQHFMYWCAVISASQLCMVQNVLQGLISNGQKEAMLDCYKNIPDKSSETNKALVMKIIAL